MGNCLKKLFQIITPTRIHKISGKKLKQLKQIAQGGYGYVMIVEDIQNRKKYALKKLICQTSEQRIMYQRQVQIMKSLSNCEHVVKYYGSHQIPRNDFLEAYILMELGQKTLYDLIYETVNTRQTMNQKQIISITKDVAKGLKQIHEHGILHQDVKVQNILFVQGVPKLCDFGSSTKQKIDLAKVSKSHHYKYQQRFQKYTTLMYRPPEMIDLYMQYPVDQRVDTWMLGCVVYVMNFGYHPFQEQGKLSIVNGIIKYPKKVNEKMQDFMRQLLTPNPHFRPKIDKVIQILDNWNKTQKIMLNQVAQLIKMNDIYEQNGQYDKIKQNEWRKMKPIQQWSDFS